MKTYSDTMNATDFGQIAMYDASFKVENATVISDTPSMCITSNSSYIAYVNNKIIPIMIGSKIHLASHPNDNPLNINGYFIIDGVCKAVNNLKISYRYPYSHNMAILPNNHELHIKQMGEYYCTPRYTKDKFAKKYRWLLPYNYIAIAKSNSKLPSKIKVALLAHFTLVATLQPSHGPICKDKLTMLIINSLFLNWIYHSSDTNPAAPYIPSFESIPKWRLLTSDDVFSITLSKNYKSDAIITAMLSNSWPITDTMFPASENMHHFNVLHDIEAVRRITIVADRDHVPSKPRMIDKSDANLICPVQSSDGSLTGTVSYIAKNAYLTKLSESPLSEYTCPGIPENALIDSRYFYNGSWKSLSSSQYTTYLPFNPANYFVIPLFSTPYQDLLTLEESDIPSNFNPLIYTIAIWPKKGSLTPSSSHLLSYVPSLIPLYNHNPAVRAMFTCSMLKQAIAQDYQQIHKLTGGKILLHSEQPALPPYPPVNLGRNLNVAILPWYGYNVEDAIVISKNAALKFTSIEYIVYKYQKVIMIKSFIPKIGASIKKDSLLAFAIVDNKPTNIYASFPANDSSSAVLDDFSYSENKYLFIRLKHIHLLQKGDKMASRHGQKGIVSKIELTTNMPYYLDESHNKIYIDLLINPHAFPSRMTMGQIVEMGASTKELYIPNKGKCQNPVLTGTCYYMALRHQVASKIQSRSIASYNIISSQPSASGINGSYKNGGLRFGSMERALLFATSSYSTLSELWSTDKTHAKVCPICGKVYDFSYLYPCPDCKNNLDIICCNKSTIIVIALVRSILYDIRWLPHSSSYRIVPLPPHELPSIIPQHIDLHSPSHAIPYLKFGSSILDVRSFGAMPILPTLLRTPKLQSLYIKHIKATPSDIAKIIATHKSILRGKSGIFHTLSEGHKLDHSARSVVIPNPDLPPNTVALPKSASIAASFAILNRQPSLSLNSFMGINIIPSDSLCIEINPLICSPFNADFDGDELVLYGLSSTSSIQEVSKNFPVVTIETQDYSFASFYKINDLPLYGLTATKDHVQMMIDAKSKGSKTNYEHIFNKLGYIYVNGTPISYCTDSYLKGLSQTSWYHQAMAAREAAVSISVNTPFTGTLYNRCLSLLT